MPIFNGGTEITDIKIGSTPINTVWIGSNKIWNRAVDTQTVTVGSMTLSSGTSYGYDSANNYGSITDGTCDFKNNATITLLSHREMNNTDSVWFAIPGVYSNSGFTTMDVDGTEFQRVDASVITFTGITWNWTAANNPFGTSVGATKTVTWT